MSTDDQKLAEYQNYIAQKHAKMLTPPERIKEFVKKAVGEEVKFSERLMLGENNEVYDIQLKSDRNVIVRISHKREETFDKEKWAIEQCQKVGVPVPKVLLVENSEVAGKFISVCVLEKLKGYPFAKLFRDNQITPRDNEKFINEIGKLLSKIHTIKAEKFGSINGKGIGHYATWSDYILDRTKKEKIVRVKQVVKKLGMESDLIDRVADILQGHQKIYSRVEPRLLHGDLGFEHIFIDGKNITGIIDWGNAASGDPIHDFAWWYFFHDVYETGLLLREGYENKDLFKEDFDLKFNLYKLYLSLDFFNYYDEGNFKPGLEIAKRNLLKSLSYFNQ